MWLSTCSAACSPIRMARYALASVHNKLRPQNLRTLQGPEYVIFKYQNYLQKYHTTD